MSCLSRIYILKPSLDLLSSWWNSIPEQIKYPRSRNCFLTDLSKLQHAGGLRSQFLLNLLFFLNHILTIWIWLTGWNGTRLKANNYRTTHFIRLATVPSGGYNFKTAVFSFLKCALLTEITLYVGEKVSNQKWLVVRPY